MRSDQHWMRKALELAEKGTALVSPNPLVGAVVVRDDRVVGEAFYTYEGRKHAEFQALQQAREAARGATLYINLEPCCHQGRTGPCTAVIEGAFLKRVVAAMQDPNPQVSGGGFDRLRQLGMEVEVGLLQEE